MYAVWMLAGAAPYGQITFCHMAVQTQIPPYAGRQKCGMAEIVVFLRAVDR